MPISKISFNFENGVQKGPGCDASMITRMKRQAVLVSEANARPQGHKGTGAVVDSQRTRGMDGGVVPVFVTRGAVSGFFKTL